MMCSCGMGRAERGRFVLLESMMIALGPVMGPRDGPITPPAARAPPSPLSRGEGKERAVVCFHDVLLHRREDAAAFAEVVEGVAGAEDDAGE
jgi:hypothetical protein